MKSIISALLIAISSLPAFAQVISSTRGTNTSDLTWVDAGDESPSITASCTTNTTILCYGIDIPCDNHPHQFKVTDSIFHSCTITNHSLDTDDDVTIKMTTPKEDMSVTVPHEYTCSANPMDVDFGKISPGTKINKTMPINAVGTDSNHKSSVLITSAAMNSDYTVPLGGETGATLSVDAINQVLVAGIMPGWKAEGQTLTLHLAVDATVVSQSLTSTMTALVDCE